MSPAERPPDLLSSVSEELLSTEGYLLEVVTSEFPFVSVLAQHLLKAGGKRLRVALAWLGSSFGHPTATDIRKVAAAIELAHLATLHHDDVIDEADTRRGVPAVNSVWTNTLAIMSGDYLFARSSQLAAEVGGEVPKVLADAISALCEGQVLEIESKFDKQRSVESYLAVIERKTARLLSAAGYLGAQVSGADQKTCDAMKRFGLSFGIAFQVADDLIDFVGDPKETGKRVGTDLKEGVYTLPVIHAMRNDPAVAELVSDPDALERIVELMHSEGSFVHAQTLVSKHADDAVETLNDLPDGTSKDTLRSLVSYVLERSRIDSAA